MGESRSGRRVGPWGKQRECVEGRRGCEAGVFVGLDDFFRVEKRCGACRWMLDDRYGWVHGLGGTCNG